MKFPMYECLLLSLCQRKSSQTNLCHIWNMFFFVRIRDAKLCTDFCGLVFLPFVSVYCLFCRLANLKDPGSAQLRPIKDTCVYLLGWGPCPPHRKVHSSGLFLAVWCQNCTHHPSESPVEDGGRIWAAQEPSKASLKKKHKRPEKLMSLLL